MDAGGEGRGWGRIPTRTVDAKEGLRDDTDRSSNRFSAAFWTWLALSLMLGLVLGLIWPSHSEAAKLSRFLTAQDWPGDGARPKRPAAPASHRSDRHPGLAKGSTPTYLAIPLYGGEHLPGSIPMLVTGSQQGRTTVGPLDFDALVKAKLDTALQTRRDWPSSTRPTGTTWSSSCHVEPTRASSGRLRATTVNELSHLLNTGSTQLTKLTQSGMNELEKLLHISSSKTSTSKPSLNLEAQVLGLSRAAGGDPRAEHLDSLCRLGSRCRRASPGLLRRGRKGRLTPLTGDRPEPARRPPSRWPPPR